jgi:hypothetical protein
VAIQTIYIQSLVFNYMFLLTLLLSYEGWGMEIQKMVLQLRSSLLSSSTYVLLASVSDMLVSVSSDQMRPLQGSKFRSNSQPELSHSPNHIRYFRKMCMAFSSQEFYTKYVKLPSTLDSPPQYLQRSQKFWPFFEKCLGAIHQQLSMLLNGD